MYNSSPARKTATSQLQRDKHVTETVFWLTDLPVCPGVALINTALKSGFLEYLLTGAGGEN